MGKLCADGVVVLWDLTPRPYVQCLCDSGHTGMTALCKIALGISSIEWVVNDSIGDLLKIEVADKFWIKDPFSECRLPAIY